MKYDYNPLSNRTKSDPVSENAINNIMHNDKIKEKKEERSFMNKFMKKLPSFIRRIYVLFIVMILFIIFNSDNMLVALTNIKGLFGINGEVFINYLFIWGYSFY